MLSKDELTVLLVDAGFLTPEQLTALLKTIESRGITVEQALVDGDYLSDDQIGPLFADAYGVKFVDLHKTEIDLKAVSEVPEIIARKHLVISYGWKNGKRQLGMVDPRNLEVVSMLQKKFGEEFDIGYTTPAGIEDALSSYSADVRKEVMELADRFADAQSAGVGAPDDLIVRIVQLILEYGYDNNASDIHVEPHERQSLIRYRVDGVLHDVFQMPKGIHELIAARIKILSNLRTDEHFAAQDGKFRVRFGSDRADVRVSIAPIVEGEKVVMRLLAEKGQTFTLESLGLRSKDLDTVRRAADRPYGMILATGPTGSGKTTTMYAVLKILNERDVNISTIEDPVEYDIEGISQIQVNARTSLTFASGLRSIVRQDPDIIMVGEIRDAETASISVNAAMTGHLVLSTLHTNDAATSLPRLLDMGVEPFLIASSVNVIIAQRLVRKICRACIASESLDAAKYKSSLDPAVFAKIFNKKTKVRAFRGKGCAICHTSGYVGRVGIFEVLEVTDKIRTLITDRANAAEIAKVAIFEGMTTMIEDGLKKVLEGVTTIEEVMRVVR